MLSSFSLLLINSYLKDYSENLILIIVFVITYSVASLFRKELPLQERLNRQKMAEEYMRKHKIEDDQFFFENEIDNQ